MHCDAVCKPETKSGRFGTKYGVATIEPQQQIPAMSAARSNSPGLPEVAQKIRVIHGKRVLVDSDLAASYGAGNKAFNQAVRRNVDRFPGDFALARTNQDVAALRSQIVTLDVGDSIVFAALSYCYSSSWTFKIANCDLKAWSRPASKGKLLIYIMVSTSVSDYNESTISANRPDAPRLRNSAGPTK